MAGPQPDFHQLSQHLAGASEQINLIPNMVMGLEVLIDNLQEHHAAALAQQAQHHAAALAQQAQQGQQIVNRLDALQEGLDVLQESQMRLPMQLYNASASQNAPLQFPPGMGILAQFITRKQDVLTLSVANTHIVSEALGLPALPNNALVAERRQQIIDFLGCAMTA